MTDLQDLLERAAEAEPVHFTVDDIRRLVRHRRRTRRAVLASLGAVSLVVGAVALDRRTADQVGVTADVDPPALERRWVALYSNWLDPAPAGAYVELREDGTLVGSDGCNRFAARWTTDDDQLIVADLLVTEPCLRYEDLHLLEVLREDPAIGTLGGADGTLRLQSDDSGFMAFTAAEPGPEEGIVETRLNLEAPAGGVVAVVFSTPRTITIGEERQIARWILSNRSTTSVAAWASYAIEGLPPRCDFEPLRRWETVGPDLAMSGRAELYPQHNLEPGERGGTASLDHVPDGCQGDFVLVLLATANPVDGEVIERRVPISIR